MVEASLEDLFPGLKGTSYQITSPRHDKYNCIAWAAGDDQHWWWPDSALEDAWPAGIDREETVAAFHDAFTTLGYVVCDRIDLEAEYEKVASFALSNGAPKHAARQLPEGRWTSKLGQLEDIEHDLYALTGTAYGSVVLVMRRPVLKAQDQSTVGGST